MCHASNVQHSCNRLLQSSTVMSSHATACPDDQACSATTESSVSPFRQALRCSLARWLRAVFLSQALNIVMLYCQLHFPLVLCVSVLCIATDEGHCRVAETFGLKTFLDAGARV